MTRSRPPVLRWVVGALFATVLVLGGASAWQLAKSQSDARDALRARFADRAPVATSAVNGLFRTIFLQQGASLAGAGFAAPHVPAARLDAWARTNKNVYASVLDARGRTVGASKAAPPRAARLAPFERTALRLGYGISDIRGVGTRTVATAVRFSSPGGPRLLVSISPEKAYSTFLVNSLRPAVRTEKGSALMVDGEGRYLAVVGRGAQLVGGLSGSARGSQTGSFHVRGKAYTYASSGVSGTAWQAVLTVPDRVLYAPAGGTGQWLPWVILGLLTAALLGAVTLMARVLDTSKRLTAANADLEAANDNLARSNADLEQFAYVASHDLSSPLRSVAGFSQMLGERYEGRIDPEADRWIGFIGQGVDRMQRIIDDLLRYSRVNQAEARPEGVDLEAVFDDVRRAVAPVLEERGAEVTSEPLPTVRGDHTQLSQVLQNLILNGATYVEPGVAPHVHVSAQAEGGMCRISVTDNGVGIEPEHADRIFKMFQRLHRDDEHPGSGIGLAITKKIVERYGGRISVRPAPGGGSTFSFTLPAAVSRDQALRVAQEAVL